MKVMNKANQNADAMAMKDRLEAENKALAESLDAIATHTKEQVARLSGIKTQFNEQFSELIHVTEQRFSDFDGALAQYKHDLDARWTQVSGAFESTGRTARQMEAGIEAAASATKTQFEALRQKREHLSSGLSSEREKIRLQSDEIKHHLHDFSAAAERNLATARQQLDTYRQRAEEAKNAIREHKAQLTAHFVDFERELKGRLDGYIANFQQLVTGSQNSLGGLEREIEDRMTHCLSDAGRHLKEDLIARLTDAGRDLGQAIKLLQDLSGSKVKEVSDDVGGTVSDINDVIQRVREIMTYLEPVLMLM